jgi:hypothetical protein
MKNTECIIYLITKHGSTQVYKRDKDDWAQTSSKGITRRMTAEQFLSHLLPALTEEYKGKVTIKVKRRNEKKKEQKENK